jgi:hypothetical protein
MREPLEIEDDAAPARFTSPDVLTSAGFTSLGEWILDTRDGIVLNVDAPNESGIYAFIEENVVAYVGIANSGFRTRFEGYCRGHEKQTTNARVKKLIQQKVSKGRSIKVLIATPAPGEWNGLLVNTAAGLEAGLIEMIRPPWNKKGTRSAKDANKTAPSS